MPILEDVQTAAAALAGALAASERAVVFTGAGISTESGIPDFRSPGGLWSRMTPITFDDFLGSEETRLEDWRRRFRMARDFAGVEPNAGHRAVVRLMAEGPVASLITQNIDRLHQRAGAPAERVVELHGHATGAACLDCEAPMTLAAAAAEIETTGRAPRCAACGGLVKAAIVSFGQPMPPRAMAAAKAACLDCDLFVVAGSSLVVFPAAGLPALARRSGARLVILNREPTDLDGEADLVLRGAIGDILGPLAGG
jgi:NAD-dependent deacetylase